MPEFPYLGHYFSVFFLLPSVNIDAGFKSVSGLGFSSVKTKVAEGGLAGFSHQLTERGSYSNLTLERGFTADRLLYQWCEMTHNSMQAQPCDILISLLNENSIPVKNWLVFHAVPNSWKAGNIDVASQTPVMESIELSYNRFIMI